MTDLYLTDDDLVITDNDLSLTPRIVDEAAQSAKLRLQILAGEVFDDTRLGVPWLTDMVNPQVDIETKRLILRGAITGSAQFGSLLSLRVGVDTENGSAVAQYTATSVDGDTFEGAV